MPRSVTFLPTSISRITELSMWEIHKDENEFSCSLSHLWHRNAGRKFVVGQLFTFQLHKNEIFKGEFCNFNSSKLLLCQVCNPCSLPYYCSCRSFFSLKTSSKNVEGCKTACCWAHGLRQRQSNRTCATKNTHTYLHSWI